MMLLNHKLLSKYIAFACFTLALTACNKTHIKPEQNEAAAISASGNEFSVEEDQFRCYPLSHEAFDHPVDYLPLPLSPDDNIWHRIQPQLALEWREDPRVQAQLNWYVKHPEYFKRVQARASRYMYFILEELHRQDAPVDLALLPIVESAFEPFAYSHGQASGLWQFIPGTARRFKLDKTWWIDERRDAKESTIAAIKYLSYLSRYFDNDWELAIAAYNAGEGTVGRAIKKNKRLGKPTDFWHLDLPKETSAYVPKMIALSQLFRNPEAYGLELVPIDNQPYFAEVELTEQLDLVQAAELAEISIDELYYLNAGLNRWATPPTGSYQLKLPKDKINSFTLKLAELPDNEKITWHRYTIKSGDSLSTIAKKFNTPTDIIKQVNKMRNNNIAAGKTLLIPTAKEGNSAYRFSQDQRLAKRKSTKPKNGLYKTIYYVKPGDSYWSIAKAHDVDIKALAKWNGKAPKDTLRLNEKLVIWTKTVYQTQSRADKVKQINYRVRSGDSLARIADKFNILIKQIVQWNQLNSSSYLQPGQRLKLYVNVMNAN